MTPQFAFGDASVHHAGGARDFMLKPFHRDEVLAGVRKELGISAPARAAPPPRPRSYDGLLGSSPAIEELRAELHRAAKSDLHVLLLGEPGAGKELAAQSARAKKPFVRVNCAALPAELFEAEMFGFTKVLTRPRSRTSPAASSWPKAARCSSTRSASCRTPRRRSCCRSTSTSA